MSILIFLIALGAEFFNGLVFMITWNWFAYPILSLPELGYAQAFGLLLVISSFKNRTASKVGEKKSEEQQLYEAIAHVIYSALLATVGFILQAIMY